MGKLWLGNGRVIVGMRITIASTRLPISSEMYFVFSSQELDQFPLRLSFKLYSGSVISEPKRVWMIRQVNYIRDYKDFPPL